MPLAPPATQADPPKTCGTWKDEVTALRSTLAKLHGAAGAEVTYELFRDHKWDIFGLESEDILDVSAGQGRGRTQTRTKGPGDARKPGCSGVPFLWDRPLLADDACCP